MGEKKRSKKSPTAADVGATEKELAASRDELSETQAAADAGVAKAEDLGRTAQKQQEEAERILRKARAPIAPLMPPPDEGGVKE